MKNLSIAISIIALFLVAPLFFTNSIADAQELVCPERGIVQLTNYPQSSDDPSTNEDGTIVAFESAANITGENPDMNREIFFVNTITGNFVQITDGIGENNSIDPTVNADGTLIAFSSKTNPNGTNPNNSREIFLYNTLTDTITQLTESTDDNDDSGQPSINADGSQIAFNSDSDFNGTNPDDNGEIFLVHTGTGIIEQITNTTGGGGSANQGASISGDSSCIAFRSSRDINGGNPNSEDQIYIFDNNIFTQVTSDPDEGSFQPSTDGDCSHVAFSSFSNIGGLNPEENQEIFIFDVDNSTFTPASPAPAGVNSRDPSISSNGNLVAFESEINQNGGNPDDNLEIIIYNSTTGLLTQATNFNTGDSEDPAISGDGKRIAFESDSNDNGNNPDGRNEIYQALCFDPMNFRNIPTLSEWGLIAMAAVLGIIGLLTVRRKQIEKA